MAWRIVMESWHVRANTETQSNVRHAGTMPAALTRPRVGLRPTMLLNEAGTRPEPAVSVPKANETSPAETATPEPELDPPGRYRSFIALPGTLVVKKLVAFPRKLGKM